MSAAGSSRAGTIRHRASVAADSPLRRLELAHQTADMTHTT